MMKIMPKTSPMTRAITKPTTPNTMPTMAPTSANTTPIIPKMMPKIDPQWYYKAFGGERTIGDVCDIQRNGIYKELIRTKDGIVKWKKLNQQWQDFYRQHGSLSCRIANYS